MTKKIAIDEDIYLEDRQIPISQLVASYRFTKVDLNDIVKYGNGIFICTYGCTNTPTNSGLSSWHVYVIQMCFSTDYCVQIATAVHSDNTIYVRHKVNGAWQNWKQLAYK